MGQWWGPEPHHDHEAKILAQLRSLATRYRCPHETCRVLVRFVWLTYWEQHKEDGHGRVLAIIDCFSGNVFERFETDVTREGRLILPQLALPTAA